jgi:MFS family permease
VGTLTGSPNVSTSRVLFASLAGTTIEFFDFYIYATAAVIVFPQLFFPNADATTAMLQSFATFSIAFFARPVGAVLFGHFGDRIGRKATLVAALLTMGLATVMIGLLPTYAVAGVWAPFLLAMCRFFQGLGLGGEWGARCCSPPRTRRNRKRLGSVCFPNLGRRLDFCARQAFFSCSPKR